MRRRGRRFGLGLTVAILVLAADQASKWAVLRLMRPPGVDETPFAAAGPVHVLSIADLALVWNRGISFGIGNVPAAWSAILFGAVAAVIALLLLRWMARTRRSLPAFALGLVIGGAAGNLADRLRFGAVVDFIYVHIGAFDWWPAFNLADSSITLGAVLLAIDSLSGGGDWHK